MAEDPLRIRIKIAPGNIARARRWGDYFFASSLARALHAFGHDVAIQTRDLWDCDARPGDVDLVLRGFGGYVPTPGRASIIWIISHPGNVTLDELAAYDHVFTASVKHKRTLRRALGAKVSSLWQAHDPEIMRPGLEPVESGLLFVGVNRWGGRPAPSLAAGAGYDVALWGAGWADHPEFSRFHRGDLIPNAVLGRHYAGARAVLNDHWRDMRLNGYVSNRIFDALACGAPLISDTVGGMPPEFTPWIYSFTDEPGFREAAEAAPAEGRERRAARLAFAKTLNERHSFATRATSIVDKARELLD